MYLGELLFQEYFTADTEEGTSEHPGQLLRMYSKFPCKMKSRVNIFFNVYILATKVFV